MGPKRGTTKPIPSTNKPAALKQHLQMNRQQGIVVAAPLDFFAPLKKSFKKGGGAKEAAGPKHYPQQKLHHPPQVDLSPGPFHDIDLQRTPTHHIPMSQQ
ncbi:hypothetical protein E3N88_43821 [Mikania micrantha]|uniref:Uncharacterized protein n=1 Tax=Mikania micrantha TaxID=192012 RepID=A0A5N6LDZ9_9ASTR|nr:hypothetical protein E3N88_43821 [Mikania micrantha]